MYQDALMTFSQAQAITAAAESTNYVDLGVARNIGVGENLYVVTVVTTAFTDSGSNSTLAVDLYGDATANSFTPDGSQRLFVIPALAAAGDTFVARISPGFAGNYRYAEMYYTPAGGDLSTGAVTSFVTTDVAQYASYAKGYTIS
jgi:hypothetical protein